MSANEESLATLTGKAAGDDLIAMTVPEIVALSDRLNLSPEQRIDLTETVVKLIRGTMDRSCEMVLDILRR